MERYPVKKTTVAKFSMFFVLFRRQNKFETSSAASKARKPVSSIAQNCSANTSTLVMPLYSITSVGFYFHWQRNSDNQTRAQRASSRLYFGRDPLGRRSLLIHKPSMGAPYLLLSSVSAGANPAYDFSELSTEHVYSLDLTLLKDSPSVCLLAQNFYSLLTYHRWRMVSIHSSLVSTESCPSLVT